MASIAQPRGPICGRIKDFGSGSGRMAGKIKEKASGSGEGDPILQEAVVLVSREGSSRSISIDT